MKFNRHSVQAAWAKCTVLVTLGSTEVSRSRSFQRPFLVPPDSARVLYGNIVMTPDGKTSVYRYRRTVTTLFLAEGLK